MTPADRPGSRPGGISEERLDALRREAAGTGRVSEDGVHAAGGPMPPRTGAVEATAGRDPIGYYGRPVVKPPVWTWEIPLYFFVGGLAGMAAVIAFAAGVTGGLGEAPERLDLVRAGLRIAVAGTLASAILLVMDLGRPLRFLAMLRVFKWRSPMSMGVWLLAAFGAAGAAGLLAVEALRLEAFSASVLQWLAWPSIATAAVLGAGVATYTGVLIGATAVPAWFVHHRSLPIHFGVAGLGSAAALLELLGFRLPALATIGLLAAAAETAFGLWIEVRRHGPADRALREGRPAFLLRSAGLLAGPVALGLRLVGLVSAAAVAFLAGALISRYGWLAAGRRSALDPAATLSSP